MPTNYYQILDSSILVPRKCVYCLKNNFKHNSFQWHPTIHIIKFLTRTYETCIDPLIIIIFVPSLYLKHFLTFNQFRFPKPFFATLISHELFCVFQTNSFINRFCSSVSQEFFSAKFLQTFNQYSGFLFNININTDKDI